VLHAGTQSIRDRLPVRCRPIQWIGLGWLGGDTNAVSPLLSSEAHKASSELSSSSTWRSSTRRGPARWLPCGQTELTGRCCASQPQTPVYEIMSLCGSPPANVFLARQRIREELVTNFFSTPVRTGPWTLELRPDTVLDPRISSLGIPNIPRHCPQCSELSSFQSCQPERMAG
jgi:hypothetical protein